MTTYDVPIGYGTEWVGVVPLGTFSYIHNITNHTIRYKFGIGGSTIGIPLDSNAYIKVEEVIYLQDSLVENTKIIVIGD